MRVDVFLPASARFPTHFGVHGYTQQQKGSSLGTPWLLPSVAYAFFSTRNNKKGSSLGTRHASVCFGRWPTHFCDKKRLQPRHASVYASACGLRIFAMNNNSNSLTTRSNATTTKATASPPSAMQQQTKATALPPALTQQQQKQQPRHAS